MAIKHTPTRTAQEKPESQLRRLGFYSAYAIHGIRIDFRAKLMETLNINFSNFMNSNLRYKFLSVLVHFAAATIPNLIKMTNATILVVHSEMYR